MSRVESKCIVPFVDLQKNGVAITTEKMKFSIKDFFSKCNQILSFLRILSHLLKKSLMENFIFCAVYHKAGLIAF